MKIQMQGNEIHINYNLRRKKNNNFYKKKTLKFHTHFIKKESV